MEKHLKANYFIFNQLGSNGKTPHKHVHLEWHAAWCRSKFWSLKPSIYFLSFLWAGLFACTTQNTMILLPWAVWKISGGMCLLSGSCFSLSLIPEQIPTKTSRKKPPENSKRWQWTTSNANGKILWDNQNSCRHLFSIYKRSSVSESQLRSYWWSTQGHPCTGLSKWALWFPSPRKSAFSRMWEHCLHL